ncbi:hypothetical protein CP02DC18_1222 [Chlamydia psittaci 02DC18]|nr:hypothetical protein CP02DC18_1222 [Chlamydia psittaci 02DC18]EPJ17574.1 hypothetical protein CP01DC11_1197 [Chlamydia psittaci 01DC11]EPJ19157.1 hypothetical protein CP02DC23_1167 [Chlamydia psittaci 02DC23]EPJ23921.1 hypothetical protein CP09DC77_1192 [Chlamydia psittaci 09DC77]
MRFDTVGASQNTFESVLSRSGPFWFEPVKTCLSQSAPV